MIIDDKTREACAVMELNNRIKTSTCGLDCGARCLLKVQIEGEVVQKITTYFFIGLFRLHGSGFILFPDDLWKYLYTEFPG